MDYQLQEHDAEIEKESVLRRKRLRAFQQLKCLPVCTSIGKHSRLEAIRSLFSKDKIPIIFSVNINFNFQVFGT